MKLFFAVGVICVGALCVGASRPEAGYSPAEFQVVQEIANTKVTLLQISRVTAFTRQSNENETEFREFTPGVEVIYLVEQIDNGPNAEAHHGTAQFLENGTPLQPAEGIVSGGAGSMETYSSSMHINGSDVPRVDDSARARIVRDYIRGVVPKGPTVDLRLQIGFGKLHDFSFSNVPF